ncbi:ABC transporter permease [Gorillibacterium sp. sgz5001074]|uniref:ABC transporter permease n=1 Tax=Gorillibacterium sp. sgz5001074 TaxID=3446695 RepID=UPI003F66B2E1
MEHAELIQQPAAKPVGRKAKPARKRITKRILRANIPLYLLFIPTIAYYITFKYIPMGGLVIAFKDYNFFDGILGSPWVGLDNFRLMFENPLIFGIIRNTFMLSFLVIATGFIPPILLAILLNEAKNMAFRRGVQTFVYLPHFLNWVIVGGFVVTIFANGGVINKVIEALGGQEVKFLYEVKSWIAIFLSSGIWKDAGYGAIIYLAALSSIDPALYEAAALDGASKWRQMWHITLPGIRPTIIIILILSMGKVMDVGFDQVYNLQNSIVSDYSQVISTYSYEVGIRKSQFSITAALGLFDSLLALTFVLTANKLAKKFGQNLF